MVMVTISPHKNPPAISQQGSLHVSSQPSVTGPSREDTRTALPKRKDDTEETTIFKDLSGQTRLLAELAKKDAEGLDDKVGMFRVFVFSLYGYISYFLCSSCLSFWLYGRHRRQINQGYPMLSYVSRVTDMLM
jgi:hypothetical protein